MTGFEHVFGQASALGSRASQQDMLVSRRLGGTLLAALADGVGGRPDGELAASAAISASLEVLSGQGGAAGLFPGALRAADDAVLALAGDKRPGPGSTLLLTAFTGDRLDFVSVGDCHLLCLREGELHFLTSRQHRRVDSEEAALLSGKATDWRRVVGQGRSRALTMALVGDRMFAPVVRSRIIREDDIYLLASDGIETLSFDALMRAVPVLIRRLRDPGAVAERVVGGLRDMRLDWQDNATLGIVHCRKISDKSDAETTLLEQTRTRIFHSS